MRTLKSVVSILAPIVLIGLALALLNVTIAPPVTTGQSTRAAAAATVTSTTYLPAVARNLFTPAFPGAEGFGARASGGRGGQVLYVTTLAADPDGLTPGSLNWALRQPGPRYILFKVSGVISATANIVYGDVTLAGQTSPGGVIVRGLLCDAHYDTHDCRNLIVRHVRSRPAGHIDGGGLANDDALRLDGASLFIVDHGSFANASDEAVQLSWSSEGTVQNSIVAETVGDHFDRGGMLLNYSHSTHPQDNLSIHHNLWQRIGGRLPEFSCELSGYPNGPPEVPSDCAAHPLNVELANNLIWDSVLPVWYNAPVDPGGDPGFGTFRLNLNMVNNFMRQRPSFGSALLIDAFIDEPGNALFLSGNRLNLYPSYADLQLVYCCNDFPANAPNTDPGVATLRSSRFAFPPVTYLTTTQVVSYMIHHVGAFPRDPMDQRYITSLISDTIDPTPLDTPGANDAFALNFDPGSPPPPPPDTDNDGMPNAWETAHGLNPNVADHNGFQLSVQLTGVSGYTNLECYLNELADGLVTGGSRLKDK